MKVQHLSVCMKFVFLFFFTPMLYVVLHSLVVPPVQIEEAPPALCSPVQHREDTDKRGELAGGRRAPLLHHQVGDIPRLPCSPHQLGPVLGPPVAGGEECTAAFESRTIESHGDDHQQARHHRQGVGCAVGQQQPPVQLHVGRSQAIKLQS